MKDAVAKLLLLTIMIMTFVGCSSCASFSSLLGPGDLFRDKRRSFIKIDIYKNIHLTRTSTTPDLTSLEDYEIDLRSAASGFII